MIKVLIPKEENFNYEECKSMYNKYKDEIGDDVAFDDIIKKHFFSFSDENGLIGAIYFYDKDGRLFVNAYAKRHKAAAYTLIKCGFKEVKGALSDFGRLYRHRRI